MGSTNKIGGSLTVIPYGEMFTALRKKVRLRQRDIEIQANILLGTYTRFENSRPCSIQNVIKLANFFKVPAKDLVYTESLASSRLLLEELALLHNARVLYFEDSENNNNSLKLIKPDNVVSINRQDDNPTTPAA
jgi:transcriptional regulator with XRE-family HTH domain